mgnify:CR=1 FL=1
MLQTTQIPINGMTCGGALESVQRVLEGLAGVVEVEVHLFPGAAFIRHHSALPTSVLSAAVERAGFTVPSVFSERSET